MKTILMTLGLAALGLTLLAPAQAMTAQMQIIHNSGDPVANEVDIYVNGELRLDDFAYRTATPFIDVPAGVNLNIGVAPGNSDGPEDILADFDVVLDEGETYAAIATGVLSPGDFEPNPDGEDTAFTLLLKDGIRQSGILGLTSVIAVHGVTNAPTVDIVVRTRFGNFPAFNNLTYKEFSPYRVLLPKTYILDVTPGSDNETIVASFEADLSGLGGGAAVVFASGFLNPENNQNGAPFGLVAALPNGDVVVFPALGDEEETASLQVIHNSGDSNASEVDVYINDELRLDDFAYRTATPFVDVPAGVNVNIGVAPGNSDGPEDILADFDVVFEAGETYVAIATGVLDPADYAPNPDGEDTTFTLLLQDGIRKSAGFGFITKLIANHGVTDAPTVDILVRTGFGKFRLFNDLTYKEFSPYRGLFAKKWIVDVTPGNDNETVVASYEVDLSGLGGGAAVVFASGFLTPDDDQGGAAFGLFAALPSGDVVAFPAAGSETPAGFTVSLEPNSETVGATQLQFALDQNYPNPFGPSTNIRFALPTSSDVSIKLYGADGRLVRTILEDKIGPGVHSISVDRSDLASGTYFYRMQAGSFSKTRRMTVMP